MGSRRGCRRQMDIVLRNAAAVRTGARERVGLSIAYLSFILFNLLGPLAKQN